VLHVYHHGSISFIWWMITYHAPGGDGPSLLPRRRHVPCTRPCLQTAHMTMLRVDLAGSHGRWKRPCNHAMRQGAAITKTDSADPRRTGLSDVRSVLLGGAQLVGARVHVHVLLDRFPAAQGREDA
jgi:hypothetical protein